MSTTLRKQIESFNQGTIIDSEGNFDRCYNFYDWFCKDSTLRKKSLLLFRQLKRFLKNNPQINQDKHYVFFKNNWPCYGPLYDDFRICDIETGDVIFTVTPKSGHTGKAEIWGRSNDFKEAIKIADTFTKLFKD